MVDNFSKIIERAKQKGEAKLKVIAPKYKVPEKVASAKLKSKRRSSSGGGSSSSSKAATQRAAEKVAAESLARREAATEAIKQKALAEAKAKIAAAKTFAEKQRLARAYVATRNAKAELKRITNLRKNLIKRGAREQKVLSRDVKTGDQLSVSQWYDKFGNRVRRIKNLTTGTTSWASFVKPKGGGAVRQVGGVEVGGRRFNARALTNLNIQPIRGSPGKLKVVFQNGRSVVISSTGRVNVGKKLAGENYVFQDGILRKISGKDIYKEKLESVEAERRDKIVDVVKLKNLSRKWGQDIASSKSILRNAAQRKDINSLKELQELGKNRNPSQNVEYNRLKKEAAENYKLGGELIIKIIGKSIIDMGVGSNDLIKALKEDPEATLAALPPAILLGVEGDFNRVMSGDPLEIASLGLEYWTFGKVSGILGSVTKKTLGLGVRLSPKYLGGVGSKLKIAPARITGVVIKSSSGKKVLRLAKKSMKNPTIRKEVALFNKKLKANKKAVDTKLSNIKRKSQAVKVRIKRKIKKDVSTARQRIEYKKSLKRARQLRIASVKKGRTLHLTSPNYKQALYNVNVLNDAIARVKTYEFINKFLEKGGNLTKSQINELLEAVKIQYRNKLESTPEYMALRRLATQDRFLSVKLIKQGKIKSARVLFDKLMKKISSVSFIKFIDKSIFNIKRGIKIRVKKVKARVTKVKKRAERKIKTAKEKVRIKKRRIVKKIKTPMLRRKAIRMRKKTIRYRMEKSRPIREVTFEQLKKSSDISKMNKFVDAFFDEMGRRQNINISTVKYKNMKNVIKKRLRKAIKTGDKTELNNFGIAVKKLALDMKKKSSKPNVKVAETTGKTRRIRTIKDFETATPKGTYQEIKVGNQIMLQEVKVKVKTKQAQKQIQVQKQKLVIMAVQKKIISLKPLFDFLVKSLSASAIKNILKSRQSVSQLTRQAQLSRVLQGSAQDLATLQVSAIASAVASKVRTSPKLRTKLKTKLIKKEKKKKLILKLPKKFKQRKVSKAQPTYYVATRKRGKIVKLFAKPLTLKDARDYLAYSIDNNLTKTAWFVPLGKAKNVATPPKNIQGYYSKVSKKLRPYKIRQGKKKAMLNGYIEKRKYFIDTAGEKKQAVRGRRVVKRKVNPTQRKAMLSRLKKARAARMRNLRRK